jgi:hypothetical protein
VWGGDRICSKAWEVEMVLIRKWRRWRWTRVVKFQFCHFFGLHFVTFVKLKFHFFITLWFCYMTVNLSCTVYMISYLLYKCMQVVVTNQCIYGLTFQP